MARLTLSEQVTAQAATIVELNNELRIVREANASHVSTIEFMQRQLDSLREQVDMLPLLKADLVKMTAERDAQKQSYTYRDKAADKAEAEIEQVHCTLDDIEGTPPREYEVEGVYGKRHRSLLVRVAGALIAIAQR